MSKSTTGELIDATLPILSRPLTVAMLWFGASFISFAIMIELPARSHDIDFSHYYASAFALRSGLDPYAADLAPIAHRFGLDIADIRRATYPPTFVLCFEPFTFLPPGAAYWAWIGLSVAALALSLWLLLVDTKFDRNTRLSLAAIALLYQPLRSHFYYAQSQLIVLFFLILMFRSIERGRDLRAGVFLSISVLLRVFPIVLAGFLIVRRKWMALAGCIASLAIGLLITVAMVGIGPTMDFTRAIPFVTGAGYLYRPANVAFMSLVLRALVYAGVGPASLLPHAAGLLLEILVLGVTIGLTIRTSNDRGAERNAFSLWIVTMIAIAPTAWEHYLVLLYIPFVTIARDWFEHEDARRAGWLAIASYALIPFGGLFTRLHLPHGLTIAALEALSVSLLVMYASVVCLVRDARV